MSGYSNGEMNEYMKRWYIKRKLDAIEYKGGKCKECGYNKCYGALHFHHRNPGEKEFGWAQLKCRSWQSIKKELDKCDLLCANCHSEKHCHQEMVDDVMAWLANHKRPPEKKFCGTCQQCGQEYTRRQSGQGKFCSSDCHYKSLRRADYPDDVEFLGLVEKIGRAEAARIFGVSWNAISHRVKRIRKRIGCLQVGER